MKEECDPTRSNNYYKTFSMQVMNSPRLRDTQLAVTATTLRKIFVNRLWSENSGARRYCF